MLVPLVLEKTVAHAAAEEAAAQAAAAQAATQAAAEGGAARAATEEEAAAKELAEHYSPGLMGPPPARPHNNCSALAEGARGQGANYCTIGRGRRHLLPIVIII